MGTAVVLGSQLSYPTGLHLKCMVLLMKRMLTATLEGAVDIKLQI